jgi:hypothetical protein
MQNEQWGTQYPWPLASYFGDSMDAVKRVPIWNGIDVLVEPPAREPIRLNTEHEKFLANFDQFIKDGRPKVEGRWGRWAAVLS